jgi:molybdenum cofactor cytidylyltransferase
MGEQGDQRDIRNHMMPRVAILVLAAGLSKRFGPRNKLLEDFCGKTVLWHTVRAATAANVGPVYVVTGEHHTEICAALAELDVLIRFNPSFSDGMGNSLAFGVEKLPGDLDGVMILAGDMPLISARFIQTMFGTFAGANAEKIVFAATRDGEQRNPVIWPRDVFPALRNHTGQGGAKALLSRLSARTIECRTEHDHLLSDIDTPDDLEHARTLISEM